jgi:predicted ATPase/class 3 adenylate cyclase
MPALPAGTVVFLFTDIEGSTARWERDQAAMALAVERHLALLRQAVDAHGGVPFKVVGDALQAAFPTAPDAVAAALEAQRALLAEAGAAVEPLRVRMALHVGEAEPDDRGDYLAPALNRLARLLAAGHGGQVLLSQAVQQLTRNALPAGASLRDLGEHRLRDLLEPERVFQLRHPDLPADFPPLGSLETHPNNLPVQPTSLIGREQELRRVVDLLRGAEAPLLTLIGPGGTGKTRLALQIAAEVLDAFPAGVYFVPLAVVHDPALVPQAIAAPLGVREVPGEPLPRTLATYIANRHMLIILDNVEQVVEAAPMVQQLLDAAPGLVILATSREPLRLRAEREIPVDPLPVAESDDSPEIALASPAIRLFLERAQAVKPAFVLDAGNVADVVAICRRLDGLPLAIELAAARVRILSPSALLARLDRRLSVLTGGARDLPERQQTLRAAIGWSYDLLVPAERTLFARLGVFAGGFTLEAGDAICNADGGLALDLLDGIDSLVQQSLLRHGSLTAADARFTMLETIREFAVERLEALPEAAAIHREHAEFFLALAEAANWDDVAARGEILDRIDSDHANLRQAIRYFEQQDAAGLLARVRLATALGYFWWIRGHLTEGRDVLERAIAAQGEVPPLDRAGATFEAAFLAEAQGDLKRAYALQEETLALFRAAGDAVGIARALGALGQIARQRGDLAESRRRHQEALEEWRRAGDAVGTAGALLDLGLIRELEGDYARAEPELQESLRLFREVGDDLGQAHALNRLGLVATATGQLPLARARFSDSLRLWRALGNRQMLAADLHNLGEAHHLDGALDEAERLYREALAIFDDLGDLRGRGFSFYQLGLLALDRGDPAGARQHLLDSLRLRWGAGLRASAAETLEALAEAEWRLGDDHLAAIALHAGERLRTESGLARQPVYEARYQRAAHALEGVAVAEPFDLDAAVTTLLSALPRDNSGPITAQRRR